VRDAGDEPDAASDIWEPIVRDLVAELERTLTHLPGTHSAVLRRARVALGLHPLSPGGA
jgi:hypothetical protein